MAEAAGLEGRVIDLARLGLGERDQLLGGLCRQAGIDGEHIGRLADQRDGREIPQRMVGQVRID